MAEPTSDFAQRAWVTSWPTQREMKLGVKPPPPARAALPERYGIALFELLVVDPGYIFISWEITVTQVEQVRRSLGDGAFGKRVLTLQVMDAVKPDDLLLERKLYGEQGRWFLQHNMAGKCIITGLGFKVDDGFHVLSSTGPLNLPRNFVVEPTRFDEMHVRYGRGRTGELTLESITTESDVAWPDVTLPGVVIASGHGQSAADVSMSKLMQGMPSSGGIPSSHLNLPSSWTHEKLQQPGRDDEEGE